MLSKPKSEKDIKIGGKSNKTTLVGALMILLALLVYLFFTRTVLADLESLNTDIDNTNTELAAAELELAEYKAIEEAYDLTTQVKRDQILKSITSELDQDEVIRDLIEITDEYSIELGSLSFSKGRSSFDGVGLLKISSSLEGNYTDLTNFLRALELNERLFNVQNISVYVTELEILDIERASFSLSINAYYLD